MFFPEHPGFPRHTNRLRRPCLYRARMLAVEDRKSYFCGPILSCSDEILEAQRSVRVLSRLETEGVAGSNITRVTALCP